MPDNNLDKLAALIKKEREELLSRWRAQVRQLPSAKNLDIPTLNDHIPLMLDELATVLQSKSDQTIPEALRETSAAAHGLQRLQDAFNIEEVVAEYNVLRGCVHDLADANGVVLQGEPFHIINRVFDHAIGIAVKTYATQRALDVQRRREEYLAFIAHDLRTPLGAISIAGKVLEMIHPEQSASAPTTKMLKALRRNVKQLEMMVDKILEENKNLQTEIGVKLERRNFDLWPFIEAIIHDIHPVARISNTGLINNVPEDIIVFGDASVLRRVFQNLLANALKYTPNGEVIIGARESGADEVECWVSDNGTGIPTGVKDKIFNPFFTTKPAGEGTGLGLSMSHDIIVKQHGGTIDVDTVPGVFTEFKIVLPRAGVSLIKSGEQR